MKKNTRNKEHATFDLAEGVLPSLKPEKYDWEKKFGFEPWHLTTIALILDVCILFMYFFIDDWVKIQIPLGYCALFICFSCCVASVVLLKKMSWPLSTKRFTKMINVVGFCITGIVLALTLMLS